MRLMYLQTGSVVGRYQDTVLDAPLRKLADEINAAGFKVLIEADTAKNTGIREHTVASYQVIGKQADLAVIMGGDGTMLGAARELAYRSVPLIGINHGSLGFITDIALHSANDDLASVIHGNYEAEDRILLEGREIGRAQV